MSSSQISFEPVFSATRVWFASDCICVQLSDRREVHTPLSFYPKLLSASPKAREDLELIGLGTGIHWNALDEDLSVEGIVLGRPSWSKRVTP